MYMKRTFLKYLLLFLLNQTITIFSFASSAYPGYVDYRQPDGSVLKIKMVGDEFMKWAETEDGYSLVYDKDGFLVYAQLNATTKDMEPTNIRATNVQERPSSVIRMLSVISKHLQYSDRQLSVANQLRNAKMESMMQAPGARVSKQKSSVNGTTGIRKGLLILVDFPDKPFTFSKSDFDDLMNQINYTGNGNNGSVRDFYKENSFGQLDFQTDVVGVYRMSHNSSYYGANDNGGNDVNAQLMASEAATMADRDINYADYDNDNDGVVDGFHIIYAGYGEEAGGGTDCVWAHSYYVNERFDGKLLFRYSCSPELRGNFGTNMTYIGVICHELGHVLGCMDYYDTNYSVGGQYQGTGNWDLMGSGNWNNDGATPAHFNPYVKIYDFGWTQPIDGNRDACVTLHSKSKDGFVRIDTRKDGEYFLIEYRSNDGFDAAVPGHGLMIYHASDNLSRIAGNTVNAYHRQQFYPLCANSEFDIPNSNPSSYGIVNSSSAPFPGFLGVTDISDYTTPSMKTWDGIETQFPIYSITENIGDRSVSFIIGSGDNIGAYGLKVVDSGEDYLSLEWKTSSADVTNMLVCGTDAAFEIPDKKEYSSGDVIGDDKVVYLGEDCSFTHTGLKGHTSYYYKLYSWDEDLQSWSSGIMLMGKTITGVVRDFPFREDFETGNLETTWKQEIIYGKTLNWSVSQVLANGTFVLCFDPSGDEGHQSTRLVLPVIDFSKCDNAVLSMDFRHWAVTFDVMYRNSTDGKWKLIKRIDSRYQTTTMADAVSAFDKSETHIDIQLPNLTSEYQIAFVGEHYWRGDSKDWIEKITIDNLVINANDKTLVLTQIPEIAGASSAHIPIKVSTNSEHIEEAGICYSIDKLNWTFVKEKGGMCVVNSLTNNTTYYYKAYAITESGTYYGDISSFKTLQFNGEGTKENPIPIGSEEDWLLLKNAVESGNSCRGLFFKLTNSIQLTRNDVLKDVFDGTLFGDGNTITLNYISPISDNRYKSLFYKTGKNALIDGITFKTEEDIKVNTNGSVCVDHNDGIISNCTVVAGNVSSNDIFQFGVLVNRNFGVIQSCSVNVSSMSAYAGLYGGICCMNFNLVTDCTFYGNVTGSGSKEMTIGGIVAMSYVDGLDIPVITNCTNYGHFTCSGAHWTTIGGICGTSYGRVDQCINYGSVFCSCLYTQNSNKIGGICGWADRSNCIISNCYNVGTIGAGYLGNDNYSGGIVGYEYLAKINNCLSLGAFEYTNNVGASHSVVGKNNQSVVENCFYINDNDPCARKVSPSQLENQELIDCLNDFAGINVWECGSSHPVLSCESTSVNIIPDINVEASSTMAYLSGFIYGEDISSSGIQWRKEGDEAWNSIPRVSGVWQSELLTGLDESSLYEFRLFAVTDNGDTYYSRIVPFATQFEGCGSKDEPYLIGDLQKLKVFRQLVHQGYRFENQVVRLEKDIDMQGNMGELWGPITAVRNGGFSGEFDGNGKTLINMRIESSEATAGFFGTTYTCYVHDLRIRNGSVISHITPDTKYTYDGGIGGIIGENISYTVSDKPLVENCSYEGIIEGAASVGGIVGNSLNASVSNCYSLAEIRNSGNYPSQMGGIVGAGHVDNSYFAGNITIVNHAKCSTGGIIGDNSSSSSAENCYYLTGCIKSGNQYGLSLTESEMKDETLLSKLPTEVWMADNALQPVNQGFPMLRYSSEAVVFTTGATKEGTSVLWLGDYVSGVSRNDDIFGFEWVDKASDASASHIITISPDNGFELLMDKQTADYYFRAFVWSEGNDTLYGEWMSGVAADAEIRLPVIKIDSITNGVNNTGIANLSFKRGNERISEYVIEYYAKNNPDNKKYIRNESFEESVNILDCIRKTEYVIVFAVLTKSGHEYRSEEVTWTSRSDDTYTYFTYKITGYPTITITGTTYDFHEQDLVIPKTVIYKGMEYQVTEIGDNAFWKNDNLYSVVIPGNVKSIGRYAFADCPSIETFVMDEGVESIGQCALNNNRLIREIHIPASLTNFVEGNPSELYAYKNDHYRNEHIGAMASLESITVEEGNPVLVSVDGVLYSKDMETLIKYPAKGGPETYFVPEGVKWLGAQSFSNTSGLKHLILPASLENISYTAFEYATANLEDISIKAVTPPQSNVGLAGVSNRILYVPICSFAQYYASSVWNVFGEILPLLVTGDANGDAQVTVSDFTAVANYILGKSNNLFVNESADVNDDGLITVGDLTGIANIILYGKPDGQ